MIQYFQCFMLWFNGGVSILEREQSWPISAMFIIDGGHQIAVRYGDEYRSDVGSA